MQFYFDPSLGCLRIKMKGIFQAEDFIRLFDELLEHEHFRTGINTLWDLSLASHPDMSVSDLLAIGAHVQQNAEKRGISKTAWVVANEIDYGIARMFEMVNDKTVPMDFRVFRNLNEAETWVDSSSGQVG